MRALRLVTVLAAAGAASLAVPGAGARAQDDPFGSTDEIIIIEEDEPTPDAGVASDDDEIIIIEDDETEPPAPTGPRLPLPPGLPEPPPPPPLPLGEIPLLPGPADPSVQAAAGTRSLLGIRAADIALTGRWGGRTGVRPLGYAVNDLWRNLADAVIAVDVRPNAPWRLHLDVFARFRWAAGVVPPDVAALIPPDVQALRGGFQTGARGSGIVEVGEAYGSIKLRQMKVAVGRQLFSWTGSVTSPLPGMINPQFFRDGLALPDDLAARNAVFAADLHGALGPVGVELLAIPFYAPPRFTFFAEDSEAWDFNEPVLSLVASRGQLANPDVAAALEQSVPPADLLRLGAFSPTLGARAFFSVRQADISVMAVLGHDPTPVLSLEPAVARALAQAADRQPIQGLEALCAQEDCRVLSDGVGVKWRRTLLTQVEANGTVGPGVLRGTFHLAPPLGKQVGRTVQVIKDGQLQSIDAWSAGVSMAYESGYLEWVQGFIELGYEMIAGIPEGARVARLEPADVGTGTPRLVHRPTVSLRFQGVVLDDIAWRLRAMVAPWQREFALAPRLGYRLSLNQEAGVGFDLFAGWPGSKGYFLMPMSRVYADWVYRF